MHKEVSFGFPFYDYRPLGDYRPLSMLRSEFSRLTCSTVLSAELLFFIFYLKMSQERSGLSFQRAKIETQSSG